MTLTDPAPGHVPGAGLVLAGSGANVNDNLIRELMIRRAAMARRGDVAGVARLDAELRRLGRDQPVEVKAPPKRTTRKG